MKRVYSVENPTVAGEGFTLDEAILDFAAANRPENYEKFTTQAHVNLHDYLAKNSASKALRKMQTTGAYGKLAVDHG